MGSCDKCEWYRARFKANFDDSRPIKWPPPGPFWETGFAADESYAIVVAYVNRKKQVTEYWPEAEDIDIEKVDKPEFSGRFPNPDWWKSE